ncbi:MULTISPECIES: fructose PTS transporter subunit IIA [Clostridium]|uniref:fructose PTS transporter subunit IIA n=1 Tax=Clostridium TaxID=1485 RepID=UPI000CDA396F|nr:MULTISPECIES: fructose PTS transporter subunit IIA [Clostridium]POO87546.1 hypothetical protein C1H59_05330 [Clostridium sp. 3-3]
MDLKNLTNENLITIDLDLNKKEDVIKYLVKQLYDEGKLSSEKDFYNAVLDREALSPTGFEAGLAVPHGKSNAVKEAAFAVAKLKRPISEWESVDENNKVELVFLLAIPTSEAGSTHIELLAELMTRISNEEYKKSLENSKDKHEFYKRLDMTIKEDDINWLGSMAGTNAALFGAILGIMVSFDLGGPVNKAAYAFCIGAMAEGIIIPYAVFASVKMVSAFGVTFATLLFKKYFNEEEQEVGKSTWLLGLAGITEGAIPFMIADPLRVIPSLCIGSAITGSIVSVFNIGLDVPGAGIFSLFVLKGQPLLLGMGVWFGAAVFGAVISAALLVITRKSKLKKQ